MTKLEFYKKYNLHPTGNEVREYRQEYDCGMYDAVDAIKERNFYALLDRLISRVEELETNATSDRTIIK